MDIFATPYTKKVNLSRPHAEYPRPQMVRDSYLNLNGKWQYAFSLNSTTPEKWEGEIIVPFAPESMLSGVGRPLQPDEFLWYKRNFTLTDGFVQGRVLLHFGAVDQNCSVFVNNLLVGAHKGGYLPFSLDITKYLRGAANELRLMVTDPTNTASFAHGRQHLNPEGVFHSPQSGIWQTVWLESVPKNYIQNLEITPLYDESSVEFFVETSDAGEMVTVQVFAMSTLSAKAQFPANQPFRLALPGAISWHTRNPFLYKVIITAGEDKLESYFGMRKIHIEKNEAGVPKLMLNNKAFFGLGIVDQGMYSDGLYTAPIEEAIKADLRYAKACGFNMIRKHGKFEPLRWYYNCDKIGLLVWQDFPSAGKKPRENLMEKIFNITTPEDNHLQRYGRKDTESREDFLHGMEIAASSLYNSPCLAVFGLFQQGVGQFHSKRLTAHMKKQDASRLVDATAGWYNLDAGDTQCFALTPHAETLLHTKAGAAFFHEVGCFGLLPNTIGDVPGLKKPHAAKICKNKEELLEDLYALYRDIAGYIDAGICGFFYNGLSDAEDEICGLLSFNRKSEKLPAKQLALLNEALLKTAGLA